MKNLSLYLKTGFLALSLVFLSGCEKEEIDLQGVDAQSAIDAQGRRVPTAEAAGNNLSFPVFWAEGVAKALRTPPATMEGDYKLEGAWWYVWGTDPADPSYPIYSCAPTPLGEFLCLDQTVPGSDETGSDVYKAWLQKDINNYWQAFNGNASDPVNIDFVDWGDNLETTTWTIQSRVRTELVLYENVKDQRDLEGIYGPEDSYFTTVTQYPMRHVSGWGTDEVHGLQTDIDGNIMFENAPGDQATVYSTYTRMTIQKLNGETPNLSELYWDSSDHQWKDNNAETDLVINEPILDQTVGEGDGPSFFNAEVNVKGKIVYGYTWDLKKLNEGTGYYRITYSFDDLAGLNTFITSATQFVEDVIPTTEADEETGFTPVLDSGNNLTYIDIYIGGRTTGGGGGNSGGGNGSGNGGGHGRNN